MKPHTASRTTLELLESVENGKIDKAWIILDAEDGTHVEEFLEPWGSLQVTLVQLAAWRGSLEILKLLYARGGDLNSSDRLGRCALFHAAHEGHVEVVRWLLEQGVEVQNLFGISVVPKNKPYSIDGTAEGNYDIGRNLPLPECWGRSALHQAVEAKHVDIVKLLVDANADADVCDDRGATPLHLASSNVNVDDPEKISRYEMVVDILVSGSASVNFPSLYTGMTALHSAVKLGNRRATERLLKGGASPVAPLLITGITPLHIAVSTGSHQVLDVLLGYVSPSMIDVQDEAGKTALHEAAYHNDLRSIQALVECGGNLAAKQHCGETVIATIFGRITSPVGFLTDILDAQVHATDQTTSKVILDFRVLAPEGELQMAVVSELITAIKGDEQMQILQHPLVEAFIRLKWSYLRGFFSVLVAVYALFLTSLSAYAIMLLYDWNNPVARRILLLSSCLLFCYYMIQLLLIPRHYATEFETWFAMISVIISIVVGIFGEVNVDWAPMWIMPSISLAILIAWIEMMLLVARFPTFGHYALMFSAVLKNVLKVLLAFIWLIIGFALSFSVLFHKTKEFTNPWNAIIKTVIMMTGEYDYSDLLAMLHMNNSTIENPESNNSEITFLSFLSGIIFLMFVTLASIVLMNLMIGLAVSDIQGLLNMGHIRRTVKQAAFVIQLDRLHSHGILQSRLLPRRMRKMLKSMHHISTRCTLEKSSVYDKSAHRIPRRVFEVLFELASANWDLDKESQADSSRGDCITKTISYLHERIKDLQREKMRIQRMRSFRRKGERQRKSIFFTD